MLAFYLLGDISIRALTFSSSQIFFNLRVKLLRLMSNYIHSKTVKQCGIESQVKLCNKANGSEVWSKIFGFTCTKAVRLCKTENLLSPKGRRCSEITACEWGEVVASQGINDLDCTHIALHKYSTWYVGWSMRSEAKRLCQNFLLGGIKHLLSSGTC